MASPAPGALQEAFADTRQVKTILIMLACGAPFGLIALLLIESLRLFERTGRFCGIVAV